MESAIIAQTGEKLLNDHVNAKRTTFTLTLYKEAETLVIVQLVQTW